MSLHIREITKENWSDAAALSVSAEQQRFIESNAFSMAECLYEMNAVSVGLYDNDTMIGFAMYGWPDSKQRSAWLDRFMIDRNFQGKGYAKRFLLHMIRYIEQQYDCKTIYLSIHPDNEHAKSLYEAIGFRLNGEIDNEGAVPGLVMELDLDVLDEVQPGEGQI
ncbi:GNAT family N-acetyltransferase [Paenibacillus sp. FSL W8-0194]|uniref:GNAT family N-acetyltransferase n=1 Tax=Paenibacillus sp. FSL W8-0194 TaxID=2921711 RepID=UPI0030D8FE67